MTNNSPWQPVLVADAAEQAWGMITAIARELEELDSVASLASGYSGLALFYAYLAVASDDQDRWSDVSQKYLERAVLQGASNLNAAGLWTGHAGVGWTVEHLTDGEDVDLNAGLDKMVIEWLTDRKWGGEYDLISGLVGIALYSIERLPRADAYAALRIIVRHLSETAKSTECGVSWWTEASSPWNQKGRTPDGHFNLGVAHGVPAVVNVLARLVHHRVEVEEASRLLHGSASWLLEQCRQADGVPYWVVSPEKRGEAARTAWCYGGLGIAAMLFGAGRLIGEDTWMQTALSLAEAAATRPMAQSGVVDAGICHGAFGVAHMFMRLYNATQHAPFRDAAVRWIDDGMSRRSPVEGVTPFPSFDPRTGAYSSDPGLLGGASGVGLVLISAVCQIRPAWDKVLLTDLE